FVVGATRTADVHPLTSRGVGMTVGGSTSFWHQELVMSLNAFLHSCFGARRTGTLARPSRRYRSKPMVEMLEDRLAPATFTVNSFLDTDNLLAPGVGPTTLRKALRLANATAAADTINFDVALTN